MGSRSVARRCAPWLLLLLLVAGCGGSTARSAAPATVRVDLIPTQSSSAFRTQIALLGRLLSQESGLTVQMRIATDYAAVVEAMRFGKTDVAYFGPFTYVVANAQSGARAFITQTVSGQPYYYSYAVVHRDSPVMRLDSAGFSTLKGATIALGDPSSTSSSQIPQLALVRAGLDRERDVKLVFTGSHDAVLKAVVARKADIGFLDSAIFTGSLAQKFPADVSAVRVVWRSEELYQYPWAHRRDLDPAVVERLRNAFLKISDPAALEPFGAGAFVPADDARYDPVREAARALGIDLGRYAFK